MLYVAIMSVDATITSCQPRTVKSVDYVDLEINAMSLIFFVGMGFEKEIESYMDWKERQQH